MRKFPPACLSRRMNRLPPRIGCSGVMRMKRRIRTDVCLILCGILVWFLADAKHLRCEAAKALALCAGTVIPALFPFMVVTGLLVRLGFAQWLAPDMAAPDPRCCWGWWEAIPSVPAQQRSCTPPGI